MCFSSQGSLVYVQIDVLFSKWYSHSYCYSGHFFLCSCVNVFPFNHKVMLNISCQSLEYRRTGVLSPPVHILTNTLSFIPKQTGSTSIPTKDTTMLIFQYCRFVWYLFIWIISNRTFCLIKALVIPNVKVIWWKQFWWDILEILKDFYCFSFNYVFYLNSIRQSGWLWFW